jgi:hypothetical protein
MIKRREFRYKYEIVNYAVLGYEMHKKEKNIIYKGLISTRSDEPRELRLDNLDRECEAQTINCQFTVDRPLVAVYIKI